MVGISPDEAPFWELKFSLDEVSPDAPLLWGLSLIKMLSPLIKVILCPLLSADLIFFVGRNN